MIFRLIYSIKYHIYFIVLYFVLGIYLAFYIGLLPITFFLRISLNGHLKIIEAETWWVSTYVHERLL